MRHDEPEILTPDEERARAAVRTLSTPADPAFRERLKQQFVQGDVAAMAGARGARPIAAHPRRARRPFPRLVRWVAVPAALVALIMVVVALNRGSPWEVSSVSGQGVAVIDGLLVPMNHLDDLKRLIRPGSRIRIPEGTDLMLVSAGEAVMQVTPGSDVTLPQVPGRWFGRRVQAELRSGELRLTTGSRFHGARLTITTPEAEVRVTGTTVAVICDPDGTCVCVLEGRTEVGPRGGPLAGVAAGHRRFVYNDEREPSGGDMRPEERTQLTLLRERSASLMGTAGR